MGIVKRLAVITLVLAAILFIGYLFNDQLIASFTFMPAKTTDKINFTNNHIEEVFIVSEDGVRLQALYFRRPENSKVILYLHGNAGNLYHRVSHAEKLFNKNYNVLLLSYRGYAKSQGQPTEAGVYLDAAAALKYLREELSYQYADISILGRSIGSAVAIQAAQNLPLDSLILVSPLASGRHMAKQLGLAWLLAPNKNPFNSLDNIKQVQAPVLVIHGDADKIIPVQQGRLVYQAHPGPKQIKIVRNGDHNLLVEIVGEEFWDWIDEFIRRNHSNNLD